MERKLVSLERIKDLQPIHEADAIETATVRGWQVVVKKGAFKIGDPCIFFEVDSFLPLEQKYEFLRKGCLRKNGDGSEGLRLKTIKLRKQISQGLAMPLDDFGIYKESDTTWKYSNETGEQYYIHPELEEDLSRIFNVVKYEPPVPAQLSGMVRGNFPSFIPKTDQERIQNIFGDPKHNHRIFGNKFEVSIKLDGTSFTAYKTTETSGVCSRNLDLKLDDEGSMYVKIAKETGILDLIPEDFAVQGEIYGMGIQDNHDKLLVASLYVFDVYDIRNGRYLTPFQRKNFFDEYLRDKHEKIKHVPIINSDTHLGTDLSLQELLDAADKTPSINNQICEGIVFKHVEGGFSFKVISNKFLLGEK